MDTSEIYTKQCEQAKEIQKLAPNKYDWSDEVIPSTFHQHIWLPRQDQLQEMITPPDEGFGIFGNDYHFFVNETVNVDFISSIFAQLPEYSYCESWEQLWLAFVMKEKYKKVWDKERKEWLSQR